MFTGSFALTTSLFAFSWELTFDTFTHMRSSEKLWDDQVLRITVLQSAESLSSFFFCDSEHLASQLIQLILSSMSTNNPFVLCFV